MQNMIRFIVVNTIIYIFPKKPIYHLYITITLSSLDMVTCLKLILGSCLQVDPSLYNFNSDPLPLPLPSSNLMRFFFSIVKSNSFFFLSSNVMCFSSTQPTPPPNPRLRIQCVLIFSFRDTLDFLKFTTNPLPSKRELIWLSVLM